MRAFMFSGIMWLLSLLFFNVGVSGRLIEFQHSCNVSLATSEQVKKEKVS